MVSVPSPSFPSPVSNTGYVSALEHTWKPTIYSFQATPRIKSSTISQSCLGEPPFFAINPREMTNRRKHQVQQPNVERIPTPSPQALPSSTLLPTPLQETKGYSSNSVPPSSPSSGPSSQSTVLSGFTMSILSDNGLVESTSPSSTSSLETASPTVALNNSATDRNTAPIIVGSILAAILAFALIIAVVAWFLRVRSRRRSQDELSWDPEPNSSHSYDGNNPTSSPSFQASQDQIAPSVQFHPPDPVNRLQPDFAEQPTMRFSYPHLATPELVHTSGPLTVTNLMPGDVPLSANTSIFVQSRPGSTQATPQIDNSAPRFTRLHGGGLPVPWSRGVPEPTKGPSSRPRVWPSRLSAASLKNVFSPSALKPTQIDSPQPRTSATNMRTYFRLTSNSNVQLPEPARTADQTWSGTIRTGITNAWSAVMGNPAGAHEPLDNNLTPIRPRPNRRLSSKTGVSTLGSMSTTSTQPVAGYPMEEKSQGCLTARGFSYMPSHEMPFNETIKEEEADESYTDSSSLAASSTLKSTLAHTLVMGQASVSQIPRVPDDVVGRPSSVPRLPTIRPLSRAWTLKSEGFITLPESDDGYRSAFDQMINERKQEYDRRLAELEAIAAEEASRPVMSRASTTSFMTESTALSRESSFMDDGERRAKKVLRMRRKRAMALSASTIKNGKVSGS